MTDKLRQAAEMALEALRNAYDASLNGDSKGCQWIVHEQITALRQALDQLPDTTKMIEREWQGLTVDEILNTQFAARYIDTEFVTTTRNDLIQFARELETMLREKNA